MNVNQLAVLIFNPENFIPLEQSSIYEIKFFV